MLIRGGKTIVINSAKGGVGKTFLSLSLAGLLSRQNKKVLIIDLDLYSGGIGVSLNLKNNSSIYDLCEDIKNQRYQSFDHYLNTYNEYIDVIIAPTDPREAAKTDPAYISNILSYAKNKYDAVIIDTTHVFDAINVIALEKADHIIELFTNDLLDIRNTANVIKLFKQTNIKNYTLILNEAVRPEKRTYTLFDMKHIVDANIDYVITKQLHLKDVEKYAIEGEIPVLNSRVYNKYCNDWNKLEKLLDEVLTEKKVGIK